MYQFKIRKLEEGGYRFELGDIKMDISDYSVNDNKHLLTNPSKAFGWFTVQNNIYGLSNEDVRFETVEAFYEAINLQHNFFVFNTVPIIDHTLLRNTGNASSMRRSA